LNVAVDLAGSGDLDRLGVRLIGASVEAIRRAEDRSRFKETMLEAGLDVPRADVARTLGEALAVADIIGYPLIVRPSFTLGGGGSGFAQDREELTALAARSLEISPVHEILLEESIAGWKEFELEVMRDGDDNGVIVCSIENVDPMGVHTGDSVTVAPQQTLPDRLYQRLRDQAIAVIRAVGVETGGSNVQFAVDWPRRRPASRSRRSLRGWPSATPSTRSRTTSRRSRPRASNRRSTTSSSSGRDSRSRSSAARTPRSRRT
jgi:carbamoyl-phosphate synthase large subunit